MINQIKRLFNSTATEITMLFIVCCMVSTVVPMQLEAQWTSQAVAASLAGGVVLVIWLVWATYILATRKAVAEMPSVPRRVTDWSNALLLIYWFSVTAAPSVASEWAPMMAWIVFAFNVIFFITCRRRPVAQ
mgnify:CR=1 FL=1